MWEAIYTPRAIVFHFSKQDRYTPIDQLCALSCTRRATAHGYSNLHVALLLLLRLIVILDGRRDFLPGFSFGATGSPTDCSLRVGVASLPQRSELLVLDHGNIIESGTHDELMARSDRYHDMVVLQTNPQNPF